MRKFLDFVRFVIISPEILFFLLPFLTISYFPNAGDVLIKPMKESVLFGFSAAAIPLAMLAFNYKEGLDLLSPAGARRILLQWPDYPQLKARVIATFAWCIVGAASALSAVWMVATDTNTSLAVTVLVSGLLASAASTATICLARFSIREILGE